MGKNDDRTLPTSRCNDVFTEGVGLEKIDLKEIEQWKEKENRKVRTKRDEILEELDSFYLQALNNNKGDWVASYKELVVNYILDKYGKK